MPCNYCDKKGHTHIGCPELALEVAKEDAMIKEWTDKNPFPSYRVMMSRITKSGYPDWYAEYGEYNHTALKVCYESYMDKDIVRKMAESIVKRGGLQALSMNCGVYKFLGPYSNSTNFTVRATGCLLEGYCDGIRDGDQVFLK